MHHGHTVQHRSRRIEAKLSIPAQLIVASLALNLFTLSIDKPDCSTRPVRAEAIVELQLPLHRRCCRAASA